MDILHSKQRGLARVLVCAYRRGNADQMLLASANQVFGWRGTSWGSEDLIAEKWPRLRVG